VRHAAQPSQAKRKTCRHENHGGEEERKRQQGIPIEAMAQGRKAGSLRIAMNRGNSQNEIVSGERSFPGSARRQLVARS